MLKSLELVGAGLLAFGGAALLASAALRWARDPAWARLSAGPEGAVFLFEGEDLIDATPAARRLVQGQAGGASDLTRVVTMLARSFGADLAQRLSTLPEAGRLFVAARAGLGTLEATEEAGALRLVLRPEESGHAALDRLSLQAAQEELDFLRGLAEEAPQPIWALDAGGAVVWANRAYLALADLARLPRDGAPPPSPAPRATWPTQPIFGMSGDPSPTNPPGERRLPLALPGREEPMWFDVTSVPRNGGTLHFAIDVGGLVLAESARAQFVQTLARTFADLSTGLVVFDRQRRLVLFNPAFLDLTGLPATFLSARPLVHTVLDRLREAKILPEPRDYASWREALAALELAAAEGQYCETWTLPGGQTYRVTGRPHPDGALAFLFEDISGELGLARDARVELDAARAVLDLMDDAVAVFAPTGEMTLDNAAYRRLWGTEGNIRDLPGEMSRWNDAIEPSAAWVALCDVIGGSEIEEAGSLRLTDGRSLALRLSPLPHGARLVAFREGTGATRLATAAE